jgi:two-component system OmpR family sensor kinase
MRIPPRRLRARRARARLRAAASLMARIRPRSLRWRLTAWVAGVMLAAAALVFVVVLVNTSGTLEGQIDRDLTEDIGQVRHALRPYLHDSSSAVRAAAARFITGQPYRATSTLLFVVAGSTAVVSNHPELFGLRTPDDHENGGEQAVENREGARLLAPPSGFSTRVVPDVGEVRILARRLPLSGGTAIIGAGEPLAGVHAAREGIAKAFVLAGALSLALALIASYLAGARVTAPLRRMASVAARVDAGDLEPRMAATGDAAEEVRVLAESFNHMLDRLSDAFEGQRAFIADASHELRTPLTVIRGQLEVLAAAPDPTVEEVARVERVVQDEVTRMARLVDDLLLLTAAEQLDFLRIEPIDVPTFVADLWDGMSLTAERRFELGEVRPGVLRADPDRLAQALRNLGRNAIEHTAEGTGLVRLEVREVRAASTGPGQLEFSVIDDGPGIPPQERELVFERLYRTDHSRSRVAGGAGLGLAIVRAIVEAHGGSVAAQSGPDGRGTRVAIVLPHFLAGPTAGGGGRGVEQRAGDRPRTPVGHAAAPDRTDDQER